MARRSGPIVNVARGVLRSTQYSSRSKGRQVSGGKIFTSLRFAPCRHDGVRVSVVWNRHQEAGTGSDEAGTGQDESGNRMG